MSPGYLLAYLYRTTNAVLAPHPVRDFGFDVAAPGVLTSTRFLAFALMQRPPGVLIVRYGVRLVQGANLLVAAPGALVFAPAGIPTC